MLPNEMQATLNAPGLCGVHQRQTCLGELALNSGVIKRQSSIVVHDLISGVSEKAG